jgi:predicted dehydrogenase
MSTVTSAAAASPIPMPSETDYILICGLGSAGRRHMANAAQLGARVRGWDYNPERAAALTQSLGHPVTSDFDAALSGARAVVLATPTDQHMPLALQAARAGKALFIEKPVSHTLEGAEELAALATDVAIEVGCQLRAHPLLQTVAARLKEKADGRLLTFHGFVGQRLDQWRPNTDYRRSYSASAARGGGALFDLVHEVDLANWLCGPIRGVAARQTKASALDMAADDLTNLILETADGACGSLQLDMLSPVYRRGFEFVCEEAILRWDYVEGTLLRAAPKGTDIIARLPSSFTRNEMFLRQMRHFLERIDAPQTFALCSLSDGLAALKILLAAKRSSEKGAWQALETDGV